MTGAAVDTGWFEAFWREHGAELLALRRHLHSYPERSREEHETTDLVAQRLRAAGLEPRLLSSGTGLWCDVGDTGPVVALRGDIDALPMDEETDLPYRSQVPGVAHACGHDVHTTIVLGAGLAFARRLPRRGRVRLIFEPAEETVPGGAVDVIADGGLDGVDAIYGLHCDPKLDVGTLGVRVGPISAAADSVEIELHGPGGHTARPHLTVDLVSVASRVVIELPARVRSRAGERGEIFVVFGALHTGEAPNVIPGTACLRGSVRVPDRALWDDAPGIVESALADLVEPTDATFSIDYRRGVPPVINHAAATDRLAEAARAVLDDGAVPEAVRSTGGDSFSWYLEHVPGSYGRLGVHDPDDRRPRRDLHSGTFEADERAIEVGVRVLVEAAERTLADRG